MLEAHHFATGSVRAKQILDNFETELPNFVRALPRDYARVVEVQRNAELNGLALDGEEIWTQILEVTGG
jgi:glutamate synthase domain-containing protein 3